MKRFLTCTAAAALLAAPAHANTNTFVNEDGSATRCQTRDNTTKCWDLTPEQYIKGIEAKTDYYRRARTTCKGKIGYVGTYAHDKCHGMDLTASLKHKQWMCNELEDYESCRWLPDYKADNL